MKRVVQIYTTPVSLTFARGLAATMRERGYELIVVTGQGDELAEFGEREQVEVYEVPMERGISPRRDVAPTLQLVRLLRKLRPDIVHVSTPKASLLGLSAAVLARSPIRLYQIRGSLLASNSSGLGRGPLWTVEALCCSLATAILCQSASLRRSLVNEGVAAADRLLVPLGGSNGVDTRGRFNPDTVDADRVEALRLRLGLPPGAPVLLFIGRLVGDKGVRELVAAWRRLELQNPELRMVMVGPFEERDSLDAQTCDYLRTHPRISLVGLDWDVAPYLSLATMLVLPTYREGFPNVLLEAAAMRVPVVATQVDGCVDAVVDGVTGVLVPARDADALHDAIADGLQNPDVLRARGIAARERAVRFFERSTMQNAMVDIYDHLLGIRSREEPPLIPQPTLDAWSTGRLRVRDIRLPRLRRFSGDAP